MGDLKKPFKQNHDAKKPEAVCTIEPFMKGYAAVVRHGGVKESGSNPLAYRGNLGTGPDNREIFKGVERHERRETSGWETEVRINRKTGEATCYTEDHPKGIKVLGNTGPIDPKAKPIEMLQHLHESGQEMLHQKPAPVQHRVSAIENTLDLAT